MMTDVQSHEVTDPYQDTRKVPSAALYRSDEVNEGIAGPFEVARTDLNRVQVSN